MRAVDAALPTLRSSVIVIGDEILSGYVKDANSGFLIERLHTAGVPLDRIQIVPDDRAAIAEALRAELARRRPRVVLTSGGVGPTPDDITVEVVAAVLDRPLVAHPDAAEGVEAALDWSRRQGMPVSAEQEANMRRLADLPADAWLTAASPGRTPGIVADLDGGCAAAAGASVVVLPGVPAELRRIVTEGVEPQLLAGRGAHAHVLEVAHAYPESFIASALQALAGSHPGVTVGSYPGRECIVRLHGAREEVEAAAAIVRAQLDRLDAEPGSDEVRARWRRTWERLDA